MRPSTLPKFALVLLIAFVVLVMGGWATLTIYFSNLPWAPLRTILAGAYALGCLAGFAFVRRRWHMLLGFFGSWVLVWIWWLLIPAYNNRNWLPEVAILQTASIDGDKVTVHKIRNFEYRTPTDFTPRYYDKTFDLSKISGVDFLWSYWDENKAIAHTLMSFVFSTGDYLCLSVEIRREKGEEYSPIRGFFKQYELIYVLGDERDLVRLRTNYRKERTYLYPTDFTPEQARKLFLSIINRVNSLAKEPVYYRTVGRNCTTSLIGHLEEVVEIKTPYHRKILMNGYADELAYEEGRFGKALPFEELKRRHFISEIAQLYNDDPEFSRKIRTHLPPRGR